MRSLHPFASSYGFGIIVLLSAAAPLRAAVTVICPAASDGKAMWAYEIGCAFITDNKVDEILFDPGTTHVERGKAGGEIYTLTASRRLGELEFSVGGHTFHPQMEAPLTLEIVDEHGRSPFLDYNAAFMMRWIDFPWQKYVTTTFATGVGLSYSSKIYQMDTDTHPGEHRSNVKFHWPIQLTFASPLYPKDQATLFISHQSGGLIFDEGGVNSVGVGYRRDF